jgi:hypothetical protein
MIRLFLKPFFVLAVVNFACAAQAAEVVKQTTLEVRIVAAGISCPLARMSNGNVISLMGLMKRLPVNTKLKLHGTWIKRSTCQQGRSFQVTRASIIPL